MKSINQFIVLMSCLFVGTSMFLVAGICAAEDLNYYYYSGKGENIDNIMYMEPDLENCSTATLNFSTKYDIEETGDFAIAFLSLNLLHLYGLEEKIDGTEDDWIDKSYDISPYKGFKYIGFYYQTDHFGIGGEGFYVDNIVIIVDGVTIIDDNGTNESWTLEGFTRMSDTVQDTKSPVIINPGDKEFEQDSTGSITWIVTETNPDKYWVLRNSTEVVAPENYTNNKSLIVPINTSELGTWNYTIFANDTSGNIASDLVKIKVIKAEDNNNNNMRGWRWRWEWRHH
jgi:bacillopeptidase F (M6 metalloprotease family)